MEWSAIDVRVIVVEEMLAKPRFDHGVVGQEGFAGGDVRCVDGGYVRWKIELWEGHRGLEGEAGWK